MGLFIGPIIAGAIGQQIEWRWFVSDIQRAAPARTYVRTYMEVLETDVCVFVGLQFWVCCILQGVSLRPLSPPAQPPNPG